MSDSDKTRDKLVSSIRKTKAGAAKRDGAGGTPPKDETAKATTSPKQSASPKQSTASEQRPTSKRGGADSERKVPYMRGTRVWPD